MSWGHKEQWAWSLVRCGLLANVSVGVSVTTEWLWSVLVAGKWLLYTTALWPWPSRSDIKGSSISTNKREISISISKFSLILFFRNVFIRNEDKDVYNVSNYIADFYGLKSELFNFAAVTCFGANKITLSFDHFYILICVWSKGSKDD